MERVATHDDRNWLLTIYVVKYTVNHNGSSIFSQFPVSCLRKLNRITWFLPCNFLYEVSALSCSLNILLVFSFVKSVAYFEEFCRLYIDWCFVHCPPWVFYNHNVSKGRYLFFFRWKMGKRMLIWKTRLKDVFSVYTLTKIQSFERSKQIGTVLPPIFPHQDKKQALFQKWKTHIFFYFFFLLTAIGWSPGGSTHLHTRTT